MLKYEVCDLKRCVKNGGAEMQNKNGGYMSRSAKAGRGDINTNNEKEVIKKWQDMLDPL